MTLIPARRAAPAVATILGLSLAAATARAEDSLLYVGGSVGQSSPKVSQINFYPHATGWKATVGTRPLPWLGAEMSYIDFGSADRTIDTVYNSTSTKGFAAYGLVYLPLPVPLFDVYGKAGLARMHSTAVANQTGCGTPSVPCSLFNLDTKNTQATYGVGAQVHFGPVAARLEYEHFQTVGGSPTLISVGLIYSFL